VILTCGKALQVIIALISIKVITSLLSESEIGNYYLLLALLTFFNFVFLNPLGQYYGRHLIVWEENKNLSNATNVFLILRVVGIIISLGFAYLIYIYFEYDKYYEIQFFILFVFIALFSRTHGTMVSAVNTLGHRVKYIKYLVSTLILGLCLSVVFVVFIKQSAMAWLFGIAFSQLFFIGFIYKYMVAGHAFSWEKVKPIFNRLYIKKISYFVMPATVTAFLMWGQNTSYRLIVEAKYSLETLAFLGVGLAISSSIFNAAEGLATQYYSPLYLKKISGAEKEIRTQAWNELAQYMVPIYIAITCFDNNSCGRKVSWCLYIRCAWSNYRAI
jgi:O-antigen/teichoic acid export membrane protein